MLICKYCTIQEAVMRKTFIGPRLRQLRRDSGQTQAQMAEKLGISPAYVNLLEKNQRSLSVQVLMALSDEYNVDWRDVVLEKNTTALSDLRNILQDPLFTGTPPDLDELRSAIDHAPVNCYPPILLFRQVSVSCLSRLPKPPSCSFA